MVEKEGTDGEKEAIRAYRAAREENDHASEANERDNVSSALIEKVRLMDSIANLPFHHLLASFCS